MKLFESVIVVCDQGAGILKMASAIRTVLESFALNVFFFDLIQKRQALEFFGGEMSLPHTDYTILCCHGNAKEDMVAEDMQINLAVVDQTDGDYASASGWEKVGINLTPKNIPQIVKNAHGTLICAVCGAGQQPFADAFLQSGYKAYIAPRTDYVDADAAIIFISTFFYFLMAEDRDYSSAHYNEAEATRLASLVDPDFNQGTRAFQYFTKP